MSSPLLILAGETAYEQIAHQGLDPSLFSTVVGASGGAKMLGLTHLDRYVFGEYLAGSEHPLELIGSSIGSWRHAAAAAPDPIAALTSLQERYLNQDWDENDPRSATKIVDELCDWVLGSLASPEVMQHICEHPRYTTHVVTARGRGLNNNSAGPLLAAGMGLSATANLCARGALSTFFQRIVFSTGASRAFEFRDFATKHVPLTTPLLKTALLASGSIPFLMSGQRNISGAPSGHYWDGGIIDYHFDFTNNTGPGLVLYPHFTHQLVKGWFDKPLKWRRNAAKHMKRVVLLAPSPAYLEGLPYGKIPDRKDFKRIPRPQRLSYWRKAMAASEMLAERFDEAVRSSDPLSQIAPIR